MAAQKGDLPEKVDKLTDSGEETFKGHAPGGGESAVIVATDSYEDLSYEAFDAEVNRRHPSGTIIEIARENSVNEDDLANICDAAVDRPSSRTEGMSSDSPGIKKSPEVSVFKNMPLPSLLLVTLFCESV